MELYNDKWDDSQIASLARTIKAIAHPARVAIIAMLANGKKLTVTEIYSRLNADQSSVSHHLSILRERNVLKTDRQGKFIFYSLKSDVFLMLLDSISDNNAKENHTSEDAAESNTSANGVFPRAKRQAESVNTHQ